MCPSRTEFTSLVHGCWKIDKSREEMNVFQTLFQLCSAFFILPFAIEIFRILRLIRSLHDAKFVPSLSGL